jgi:hypothetical protein
MSVKTGLTGCDPLQLVFKLGIDRFMMDLAVPLFLRHRSLPLIDGERTRIEVLLLLDGGVGIGFGINIQALGIG